MNDQTSPGLIIALGKTGLRAAGQVYHWRKANASNLGLIGVGFDNPPGEFPASNYLRLAIDPDAALKAHDPASDPQIEMWLNSGLLQPTWQDYALLPRPLERLAWFHALGTGERSRLFELWRNQLPTTRQTVLVFLLADLGEACGSSLILDAVVLTRMIAARYNRNVAILLHTVLPGADAPEEEQLRAYVALRELAQFVTSVDPIHGYPFHYAAEGEFGRSTLKTNPFDAWYCFERSEERDDSTAATLAEIVNVYLGRHANEVKRQRMVNVSGRIAHLSQRAPVVGTANVQSLVLPVEQLQRRWALELAIQAVSALMADGADSQQVARMHHTFWTGFPVGSLEASLSSRRLRIARHIETRTLDDRVAELDRMFFPTRSISPAAYTRGGLSMRSNRFMDGGPTRTIHETVNRAEALLQLFGAQNGNVGAVLDENDYSRLLTGVVDSHLHLFDEALNHLLSAVLKNDGLTTALGVLARICEDVDFARAIFETLRVDEAESAEDFVRSRRLKAELVDENATFAQRADLRRMLDDYQVHVAAYLDRVRLKILLAQGRRLLDEMQARVTQVYSQLADWQRVLLEIQHGYEQLLEHRRVFPASAKRLNVLDGPDDPWAKRQQDRYVERIGGRTGFAARVVWAVTHAEDRIALLLNGVVTHRDRLPERLLTEAGKVFQDARQELSLLTYLNSLNAEQVVQDLVRRLRAAERLPLQISRNGDTIQTISGALFAPTAEHRMDERLLKRIEVALKSTHHVAVMDNQLIHREQHDNRCRVTYLFVAEFINMLTEMKRYAELESRCQDWMDHVQVQSIFRTNCAWR